MQADEQFIAEHEGSVRRIAARLCAQLDLAAEREELEAWGKLGLVEARRRFDPDRGVRFSTFAYYRIRGAMLDGVRNAGYVSRRAHAKLRAAEAVDALAEPLGEAPAARSTEARARHIDDTLGKLSAAFVISAAGQDPEARQEPQGEERLEARQRQEHVSEAVKTLAERERRLIEGVYFEGRTLEAVAAELGLSKSWGSRLHAKVLGKLRDALALST